MEAWPRKPSFESIALRESPNDYLFLCQVSHYKGDFLRTLRCCERAIQLRPNDAEAYLLLGVTLTVYLRLYNEAVEALDRAAQLDPLDPQAVAESGFLRCRLGDLASAEALLRRAIELTDGGHPNCSASIKAELTCISR